jgi:hypothetical protein
MERLINSTHTHSQETRVAFAVLLIAAIGFVFYFVSGTPVNRHGASMASQERERVDTRVR